MRAESLGARQLRRALLRVAGVAGPGMTTSRLAAAFGGLFLLFSSDPRAEAAAIRANTIKDASAVLVLIETQLTGRPDPGDRSPAIVSRPAERVGLNA